MDDTVAKLASLLMEYDGRLPVPFFIRDAARMLIGYDKRYDEQRAEIERLMRERDELFATNGNLANTIGAENLRLRAAGRKAVLALQCMIDLHGPDRAGLCLAALNHMDRLKLDADEQLRTEEKA